MVRTELQSAIKSYCMNGRTIGDTCGSPMRAFFFRNGAAFVSFSVLCVILNSGLSGRNLCLNLYFIYTCLSTGHEIALISSSVGGRISSLCSCFGTIPVSVFTVA